MRAPPPKISADIAEQPTAVAAALARDRVALADARALVAASMLVRVIGIGSSRHAGGYAAAALEAIGGRPAVVADAPGAGIHQPPWREGDLALVLSQSGTTPALADAVRTARSAGARVVLIVNRPSGPLEGHADVVLHCGAGAERVVAATKSVLTQLALARALARPLTDGETARLATALSAALDVDLAAALRCPLPGVVAAGGFAGGWLADEVALKFAEVAGVTVSAEPLIEYLHGPIAARAAVLALADVDDPNLAALSPAPMVRIGGDRGATVCVPPCGDPSLDVLPRLVAAQRLVVGWALRRGADPDAGRGLSKVTATR